MPKVQVNLYSVLRNFVDGAPSSEVEISQGESVEGVLAQLGVPADQVQIIFVDNRAAWLESPLEGGELLDVFPAIGGG